jgi:hypothetical protein
MRIVGSIILSMLLRPNETDCGFTKESHDAMAGNISSQFKI